MSELFGRYFDHDIICFYRMFPVASNNTRILKEDVVLSGYKVPAGVGTMNTVFLQNFMLAFCNLAKISVTEESTLGACKYVATNTRSFRLHTGGYFYANCCYWSTS